MYYEPIYVYNMMAIWLLSIIDWRNDWAGYLLVADCFHPVEAQLLLAPPQQHRESETVGHVLGHLLCIQISAMELLASPVPTLWFRVCAGSVMALQRLLQSTHSLNRRVDSSWLISYPNCWVKFPQLPTFSIQCTICCNSEARKSSSSLSLREAPSLKL